MKNDLLIINGPNLNLLGKREPELYGHQTFEEYFDKLLLQFPNADLHYIQTNHEGVIIDKLHEYGFQAKGIILNAGGYTHTSIAIADAIKGITAPVIEVHITDISKREPYRQHSYLTPVCKHHIMGKGLEGYKEAVTYLLDIKT